MRLVMVYRCAESNSRLWSPLRSRLWIYSLRRIHKGRCTPRKGALGTLQRRRKFCEVATVDRDVTWRRRGRRYLRRCCCCACCLVVIGGSSLAVRRGTHLFLRAAVVTIFNEVLLQLKLSSAFLIATTCSERKGGACRWGGGEGGSRWARLEARAAHTTAYDGNLQFRCLFHRLQHSLELVSILGRFLLVGHWEQAQRRQLTNGY